MSTHANIFLIYFVLYTGEIKLCFVNLRVSLTLIKGKNYVFLNYLEMFGLLIKVHRKFKLDLMENKIMSQKIVLYGNKNYEL